MHSPLRQFRSPHSQSLVIASLVALAQASVAVAQPCLDQDDHLAVSTGDLASAGAFDTLFELEQCQASGGAVGSNPPVEFIDPTTPTNGYFLGGSSSNDWLSYRFVPLCADGSGDHEYTVSNPANPQGTAPTCAAEDYIRCGDGTRPVYYADHAVGLDVTGQPADIPSDNWVFFLEGGSNCASEVHRGDEFTPPLNTDIDQGEMCWIQYGRDRAQLTTDGARRSKALRGILAPHAENHFSTFHRVNIDRCTQDLWLGDRAAFATYTDSDDTGSPVPGGRSYTLFRHGQRIVRAVMKDLESGATFGGVPGEAPFTLDPLSQAENVLLTGNSNGAFGLIHSGDALVEYLRTDLALGANANLRLVIDNRWKPGLENEAAFNDPALSCGGSDCTQYDGVTSGTSSYPVIDAYSPLQYQPHTAPGNNDGKTRVQLDSWADVAASNLDQSCVSTHLGTAADWKCYDLAHVLAHHVSTPFLVHSSLNDFALRTHPTDWSDDPIRHEWTAPTFLERMTRQLEDLFDERATRGDEGLDNTNWSMAIFAPDEDQHVAIVDDPSFLEICLEDDVTGERFTYMTALQRWLHDDDPTGAGGLALDLIEGSVSHPTVRCDANGPLFEIFSDGFELGSLVSWSGFFP